MLSTDEMLQCRDGRAGYLTLELSELGSVSKFYGDPLANANPNNPHSSVYENVLFCRANVEVTILCHLPTHPAASPFCRGKPMPPSYCLWWGHFRTRPSSHMSPPLDAIVA